MFVTNFSHISRADISKSKRCLNVKSSTYYFRMKTKILLDFQICISVPLSMCVLKMNFSLNMVIGFISISKRVYEKFAKCYCYRKE